MPKSEQGWNNIPLSCNNLHITDSTNTHTHLRALFRDYPGEPVPER